MIRLSIPLPEARHFGSTHCCHAAFAERVLHVFKAHFVEGPHDPSEEEREAYERTYKYEQYSNPVLIGYEMTRYRHKDKRNHGWADLHIEVAFDKMEDPI